MIPNVRPLMTRPGSPPIADQIVAPSAFIPVPIIRKEAIKEAANPGHTFFREENMDEAVIDRIVTIVRINSILIVFSPVCLSTIPLYMLYCSAVILPDNRN